MESFLQYVTGGECYECGGKVKFFDGGENMQSSPQAQPQSKPGADEQVKKLMFYLSDQMSKGTSPNILKKNMIESGIKAQDAEQLIGMATQSFNNNFHKGLEPTPEEPVRGQPNPFSNGAQGQEPQDMKFGGGVLDQYIEGGFTRTDHNQISNIPETKFNRGLARMSGLSNVGGLMSNIPDAGGFGAGLKFLAGAAGFLGSAGLGIKKFTSDDRVRSYDNLGNITKDSMFPDRYKKTTPVTPNVIPETMGVGRDSKGVPREPVGTNANAVAGSTPAGSTPAVGAPGVTGNSVTTNTSNTTTNSTSNTTNNSSTTPSSASPTGATSQFKDINVSNNSTPTIPKPVIAPKNYLTSEQSDNLVPTGLESNLADKLRFIPPTDEQLQKEELDIKDPMLTKEYGGEQEWNPFVDNRRKLKFTMPLYVNGGEPTFEEWFKKNSTSPNVMNNMSDRAKLEEMWKTETGQAGPLNTTEGPGPTVGTDAIENPQLTTNPAIAPTTDANSVNASGNTSIQNPFKYDIKGDPLGFEVANNGLNGLQMMAGATNYFSQNKQADKLRRKNIMMGNTMEAASVVNPVNAYGSMYSLNAGPGANQALATQGHAQQTGFSQASGKYGGDSSSLVQDNLLHYKKGGVYQMSPKDLQRFIEMGGEVEFLD